MGGAGRGGESHPEEGGGPAHAKRRGDAAHGPTRRRQVSLPSRRLPKRLQRVRRGSRAPEAAGGRRTLHAALQGEKHIRSVKVESGRFSLGRRPGGHQWRGGVERRQLPRAAARSCLHGAPARRRRRPAGRQQARRPAHSAEISSETWFAACLRAPHFTGQFLTNPPRIESRPSNRPHPLIRRPLCGRTGAIT